MRVPHEGKPCLVRGRVCDSARGRRGAGGADGTHGRIRTEIGTAAEPRTVSEDVGIRQSCRAATGDVAGGGPATLPDPNIFANGAWFGGSPYLGPDATVRAVGSTGTTPPSGTVANSPTDEAGFAFMWHSHNEREITTNNVFPGGMLMMMLVDSREFVIDESK